MKSRISILASSIFWLIMIVGFILPIFSILINVLLVDNKTFVGISYFLEGFKRSFFLSMISLIICWIISIPLITGFCFWNKKIKIFFLIFFIFQLQIGIIPRLYGYLGAYSNSGIIGYLGRLLFTSSFESPFAYNILGTSIALTLVYSPFFFLPLISKLMRVDSDLYFCIIDMGGTRLNILFTILKSELRWSLARYSFIFFLITFSDFVCSDLVGGGKVDAFGKTIYVTLVTFQDYWGSSIVGVIIAMVVLLISIAGFKKRKAA